MRKLIIWADDDQLYMDRVTPYFTEEGFDIVQCTSITGALSEVVKGTSEYLLLDIMFPGNPKEGIFFLEVIKHINPHLKVVLFTSHPVLSDSVRTVRDLMASDYIEKRIPEDIQERKAFFYELHKSFNIDVFRSELIKVINGKNSTRLDKMRAALEIKDIDSFIEIVKTFLAEISYDTKTTEGYYHAIIQILLSAGGIGAVSEKQTNIGRIDIVAQTEGYIYVMEFKIGNASSAIEQIKDRKYYEQFSMDGRKVIILGIAFCVKRKNISEYLFEEYVR